MGRADDPGDARGGAASPRAETADPTVHDRPVQTEGELDATDADAVPDRETIVDKPRSEAPVAPLEPRSAAASQRATPAPTPTIATAADAMHDEEVFRLRLFIRIGWLASIAGLGAIPFVAGEPHVTVAYIAALVLGMVVSFYFHQTFRDPRRYTDRSMGVLGVMAIFNAHVAILFFGAFTVAPLLGVVGLHFIGRSELASRRAVYVTAAISHGAIAIGLIAFALPDPGIFATARPLGASTYMIAAIYVQAAYAIAYATGQIQRRVSLRAIGQLQRATRIASQRAALLDELRADLERAQHAGAGRYTGQILGGYKLGIIIGRGAHGEVYDAIHVDTDAPAAVKLLHREHLADPTTVARFVREVRATAAASSPHIVRVLATSEPDAALPFLAMEKLNGMTLAEKLRRTPVLAGDELLALVTQVGAAIDDASATGVVHRDLKPQNLFVSGTSWKVLDFGVAALGEQTGTLTRGGIVGTPHYMAPEQARGGTVDHRADLYALGAIAYRALTGRNPFGGSDTPTILYAVVHTMPVAPSTLAELPADVDRWAALALAKDPAERWQSGAALASHLGAALAGMLDAESIAAAERVLAAAPWRSAPQ